MKDTDFLANIKIASPCSARWEDMSGDDRSRFCQSCEKHVYNFSAMTNDEASELIRAKEGKLCGRFYRRQDGRMLTANCPIGANRSISRIKAILATGVTLLMTSFGVAAYATSASPYRPKSHFAQKCDDALWTVKGWLGFKPAAMPMIMGEICVSPPPVKLTTNQPPPSKTGSSNRKQ